MNSEKLIEEIREHQLLYDFNDKKYHDTEKKDVIWSNIANKLKVPEKECKKHWNALRDSFRRNLKKRKITSCDQSAGPVRKWKYENEMAFLLPYIKERARTSSIIGLPNEEANETEIHCNEVVFENIHPNVIVEETGLHDESYYRSSSSVCSLPVTSTKQLFKTLNQEQTASSVIMNRIPEENLINEKQDEIEALFYSLAQTVKRLPPYYRAVVKAKVCSIIFEFETKCSSNTIHTSESFTTPVSSPASLSNEK